MLQVYTSRKIHIKTVETSTATLIVAVLVETYGNETRTSEPKIIRVISKQAPLQIAAPVKISAKNESIVSPYASEFSFVTNTFTTHVFARPPTK